MRTPDTHVIVLCSGIPRTPKKPRQCCHGRVLAAARNPYVTHVDRHGTDPALVLPMSTNLTTEERSKTWKSAGYTHRGDFTRLHTNGTLVGLETTDSIPFVSAESAIEWRDAINAREERSQSIGYKLVSFVVVSL